MDHHQPPDRDNALTELRKMAEGGAVLYVEDEIDVRVELAEILGSIFPRVVTAENGVQGLAAFQEEAFLVVITDINMPEMNGIDMIREIQRFKPQQSIMVTSAYSDAKFLIPLINLGIGSFLLKPLNLKLLLQMVKKELSLVLSQEQEARYQKRLEKEIQFRTRELQESQTQVLRLQAAKDNMLALISHELRTPLNGMLGFTELVRPHVHDEEAQMFLSFIEDSARRLDRSTQKALDFSVLSTGKRVLNRALVSLDAVVNNAWDLIRGRSGMEGVQAPVLSDSVKKSVFADGELLVEAVKNILENAVKYAGALPLIEVSLEHDGNWDVVKIRDHGAGFTPAALERLFEPFSSGNIMHHSEGMGLGLALTDVIMLTLGGKISAGNAPEGGAVIRLYLPMEKS